MTSKTEIWNKFLPANVHYTGWLKSTWTPQYVLNGFRYLYYTTTYYNICIVYMRDEIEVDWSV